MKRQYTSIVMVHDGMDDMGETYYRYFAFTRRYCHRRGILHWRATYTFNAWEGNVVKAAFNLKLRMG